MIAERDIDAILRSWAAEGVDALPDRVLDSVLRDTARVGQRRRSWLRLGVIGSRPWLRAALLVAALLMLIAAVAGVAGGLFGPRLFAFDGGEVRLVPGRYVIDAPFAFHLSVDVPDGWVGVEMEGSWVSVGHDEPEPFPELIFARVGEIPVDPCRSELGIREPLLGPRVEDLVVGFAGMRGIGPAAIRETTIGGRAAWGLTLDSDAVRCESGEEFTMWNQPYSLPDGMRQRIWIVEVDGGRLVIGARDFGPETDAARDLDGMVGSLRLGADAPDRPSEPPESEAPPVEEPTIAPLPTGFIPERETGYLGHFDVYAYDSEGIARIAPGQHDWVMPVIGDWWATGRGMATAPDGPASASLNIWAVARVYRDPCHWAASPVLETAERVGSFEPLARAFSDWWGPDPNESVTGPSYVPPAHAPEAGQPSLHDFPVRWSRHLELRVPAFDVSECDEGKYIVWVDQDGTPRLAQPGEVIVLRIAQLQDGVVVLEAGYQPNAGPELEADVREMLNSSYIGPPL